MSRKRILLLTVAMLFLAHAVRAQLPYSEVAIPVRDGKTLAADIYNNNGVSAKPVILVQTPYNKATYRITLNLPTNITFPLDTASYHYVFVDWRGFYASAGASEPAYNRGLDGYDIVEWIAAQDWCNGKVATYGGSALGMIQFQTASEHPPHLVCAMPMIIDYRTDYFDYYYGGVLRREHVGTLERLGFLTVNLITSIPIETATWRLIQQTNDYPEEIAVPLLMVSGWFDHYPADVLRAFSDLRARSDEGVRNQHRCIMGPWLHAGIDQEKQGELTYPDTRSVARDAALRFFAYYLLGAKNGWPLEPVMRYYQMGENTWQTTDDWEALATTEHVLWLRDDGRLTTAAPGAQEASREVECDPRDPSPSHGGARFNPFDQTVDPGPIDIRSLVEARDDVLLYSTDVLDAPVRILGKMRLELSFRSDRRDADFSVRLCDVYPDGRSVILTDGIHRARFREGTDHEVFLEPGVATSITVELQDLAHTFLPGHRIRLVVAGSDYPRFDINLHDGGPMYVDGDTLIARHSILHAIDTPSRFLFGSDAPLPASRVPAATGRPSILSVSPQPFHPATSSGLAIQYSSGRENAKSGTLIVRDLLGRPLRRMALAEGTGTQRIVWDGKDHSGQRLAAGVYMLVLHVGSSVETRPVLLISNP
jgi:predicted acyl esterase